ncbi:MAG TPA: hypothetical protein V6D22_19615 [Candidatus Obscuribacterales bacterium]
MRCSLSLFVFLSAAFAICASPVFAQYNSADADYDRAEAYARRAMDASWNSWSYDSYPATYIDRNAFGAPSFWGDSQQQLTKPNTQIGFNNQSPVIYPNTTANPPQLSNGTGANSCSPFGIAKESGINSYRNTPSTAPFYPGLGLYGLGVGTPTYFSSHKSYSGHSSGHGHH